MLALADCADLCPRQIFNEHRRRVSAGSGSIAEMAVGPTGEEMCKFCTDVHELAEV
jgi:hypothetical protein